MSRFESIFTRVALGQGNIMEDANPVPVAFRGTPEQRVAPSTVPCEACGCLCNCVPIASEVEDPHNPA